MESVPTAVIAEVWQEQCELDETDAQSLVKRFFDEQPALGLYVAAVEEQFENEEGEASNLIPLAAAIWQAMSRQRGYAFDTIEPETVDEIDDENVEALISLGNNSETGQQQVAARVAFTHPQADLLRFCTEILMAGNEQTPELAPDRIGLDFLTLKTLIECLDRQEG
jgi:hypothetical protein